jgi:hypothetical protein
VVDFKGSMRVKTQNPRLKARGEKTSFKNGVNKPTGDPNTDPGCANPNGLQIKPLMASGGETQQSSAPQMQTLHQFMSQPLK